MAAVVTTVEIAKTTTIWGVMCVCVDVHFISMKKKQKRKF